jgi:preprotein translocase subunit SecG
MVIVAWVVAVVLVVQVLVDSRAGHNSSPSVDVVAGERSFQDQACGARL